MCKELVWPATVTQFIGKKFSDALVGSERVIGSSDEFYGSIYR